MQERLGHSAIGVTLDTYSHVIPSLQEEAADLGAALLEEPTADEEDPIDEDGGKDETR